LSNHKDKDKRVLCPLETTNNYFNETISESGRSTAEITESYFNMLLSSQCLLLASFTAKSLNLGYIPSKSALRSSGLMNTNKSQRHIRFAFHLMHFGSIYPSKIERWRILL